MAVSGDKQEDMYRVVTVVADGEVAVSSDGVKKVTVRKKKV